MLLMGVGTAWAQTPLSSAPDIGVIGPTDTVPVCQGNTCNNGVNTLKRGTVPEFSTFWDGVAHVMTGQVSQPPCMLTDVALPTEIAINAATCGAGASPANFVLTVTGVNGFQPHMIGCPTNPVLGQVVRFKISEGSTVFPLAWDQRCWGFTSGAQPDFEGNALPNSLMLLGCDTTNAGSPQQFRCGPPLWNANSFSPSAISSVVSWVDPSVATTVFSGTSCSGATVTATGGGAAFGSIQDLGTGGFCWTSTNLTYKLDANSKPVLHSTTSSPGGYLTCNTGTSGIACNTLGMAVSNLDEICGINIPVDAVNQFCFWIPTNGGATIPRFAAGWDVGGTLGAGPGLLARAPDNQASNGNASEGTITGWTGTPIVIEGNMVYVQTNGYIIVNNNSLATGGGIVNNTASDGSANGGTVYIGYNPAVPVGLQSGTDFYGEALVSLTSGPLSHSPQQQLNTYFCTKEGQNGGLGC